MSRAQATRSLRALQLIAAKAMREAEDWADVADCFRADFEQLAETARSLGETIEDVYPGRRRNGKDTSQRGPGQHDNQQELPLE